MPHSKFIVRMIPISSGLMKCTCGQMIKYETEREQKMNFECILRFVPILRKVEMILGLLGNAGRWKRVKDIKMTDIESFTVNMYPDG